VPDASDGRWDLAVCLGASDVHAIAPVTDCALVVTADDAARARAAAELARHGLFRDFTYSPIVDGYRILCVRRGPLDGAVGAYEWLVAQLEREAAARRALAIEYRAAAHERDVEIDRLQRADHGPADYKAWFLDLLTVRARFAPEESRRGRAFDEAVRRSRALFVATFRAFDARDRLLDRARGALREWRARK
jgi:hypothetical protein